MFAAVILVCGLESSMRNVVDGCGIVQPKFPFTSIEQCEESVENYLVKMQGRLPEGSYVNHATCVAIGLNT
jgi:hypothetical protein